MWEAILASPTLIKAYGVKKLQRIEDNYWASWEKQPDPALVAIGPDGALVGAVALKAHDQREGKVVNWRFGIGVRREVRGRGVGRQLLLRTLEFARQSQAEYLTLFVDPTNTVATRLYQQVGFRQTEGMFDGLEKMEFALV